MAPVYTYGNPQLIAGKYRVQRIKLADAAVPILGGGEADISLPLDCLGADRMTINVQNRDAALDADIYVYQSPLEAPAAVHDAGEWELKPYSGVSDKMDADHGTLKSMQLQGPFKYIKIRGLSSGAAIASGVDIYLDLFFP